MPRSLRARILLGYGAAVAVAAAAVAVALVAAGRLGEAPDGLLARNYASVRAAAAMVEALERMDSGTLLALAGDPSGPPQAAAYADTFAVWSARASDNVTEPGEPEALARLDASFRAYERVALAVGPGTTADYRRSLLPAFAAARADAEALGRLNASAMAAGAARARADARRAAGLTLAGALAALAVGLAFSLGLAGALARPLRAMREAADAIARGRYDVALPRPADDDLGGLARAMDAMATALRDYDAQGVDRLLAEKRKTDAVLLAMDDGVVVVDAALRVAAANPAAERLLGPLAPGQPLAPGDRRLLDALADALAGRAPASDAPPLVLADAAGRHVEAVATGLAGPAPAALLLLRDLTRLHEADRARRTFVQAASHELRTPLTGLGMALEMLRAPVAAHLDAPDRELFDVAVDEQRRLSALADRLLELARLEAGEAALRADPLDVRALLAEAAERFAAQAAAQGLTVEAVPGAALPAVPGDEAHLALVLSNLVANALRHARTGVRLSAERTERGVAVRVEDDGPGVDPAWRTRIFEPLAQAADGRPGAGGLGLALCRSVVRTHGGTVRVEAAPGGGAAFVVELPAR